MATAIEQELVEATGFEPTKNYERQDYLAALARAVNDIEEADFDGLTVDAQDWFNAAVKALNKKQELPDFPDAETEAEVEEAAEAEEEAEASIAEEEPEAEEKPKKKGASVKQGAKAAAADKKAKAEAPKKRKGQPPRKLDHPPIVHPAPDTKLEDLDFAMDRFGIVKGSKNHSAAAMLEKGCRMADVTETIGGTYYNLLQRLTKQGHLVEKASNGELKLTHKDDVKKVKGKK
jgi:hypothetical protein